MIGIDSNVLVRIIANDDAEQVERVRIFLSARNASSPAYVSAVVLAESVWVLRSRMGFSLSAITMALERLLESDDLRFQHADRLMALFGGSREFRGDLADHLIAWTAQDAGCARTVTFDKRAASGVPGMELLA